MDISTEHSGLVLSAESYRLVFRADKPFVILETAAGETLAELFVFSSVHAMKGRDETYRTGEWSVLETPDGLDVGITAESTFWQSKTYRFRCLPQRFTYDMTVEGQGALAEVDYFGGYYSEKLRWGSGFFWSGQQFRQLFNPEPNTAELTHHTPAGSSRIDLTGVPLPARGDWFFTPPPFCFAGQLMDGGWLALGVEAEPGRNSFTEYQYHGSHEAFYLSLAYEGHTHVNGVYRLPSIGFDFAADEYTALGAHVRALQSAGHVPPAQSGKTIPDWWRTPIFCGWGSQCSLALAQQGHAPDYARQEFYEDFLSVLEQNGLQPGIVVLDDKWQAAYGDNQVDEARWPDLRGFIETQHAQGRRVLLWLKAWDPEGVPDDECVLHRGGAPVAIDVTNPAFEERLRASVRRMLSSEGYDADGFKIDFTARIPSGPGLHGCEETWGLELMKRYLWIVYSEAKKTKPDALVMSHTPHPYLADVTDMIRLNDINIEWDVNKAMRHRAKVAALACPEAIIDTDNWPIPDKATWRAYVEIQAELGVPSLYFATHIDRTHEPLTAEDYQLVQQVWADYRSRQGRLAAEKGLVSVSTLVTEGVSGLGGEQDE